MGEGGEAGRAVCIALRIVDERGGDDPTEASGEEVRRRVEGGCSRAGEGNKGGGPDPDVVLV